MKLAELLAKNEEFAKEFASLKSVNEQYNFAQKSVSGYTKEEFKTFLDELERSYKLKISISPEDMEKVSGGANVKTKAAAMAMLALSAVGTAAPMLTSASAHGSEIEAELGRVTAGDDDVPEAEDEAKIKARVKALHKEMDGYGWMKRDKWWLTEEEAAAERKAESVQQGPLTEEDYYESLTDKAVGNDHVLLKFNPEMVPLGFAKNCILSLDKQIESSEDGHGWAIVGDILCRFGTLRGEHILGEIRPLFYNKSGKACKFGEEPIKVIKIPDYVNGCAVTGVHNLVNHFDINEYFPDLECLILPRTLKYVTSESILQPAHSRPLKIYLPRGTNYRYVFNDGTPPLQPGLHVMQPLNFEPSQDVLAFPPAAPQPPADPWCTIM